MTRSLVDEILEALPGKRRAKHRIRGGKKEKRPRHDLTPGAVVRARWMTKASDGSHVGAGTLGSVSEITAGKAFVMWTTGSSGWYDPESLEKQV